MQASTKLFSYFYPLPRCLSTLPRLDLACHLDAMGIFTAWIAPVLNAIVLDLLFPNRWFLRNFLIITTSFFTFLKAVRWSLAGYVDSLYLDDGYQQSFSRISAFLVAPIALRSLLLSWHVFYVVFSLVWSHVIPLIVSIACFFVLCRFLSLERRKKLGELWIELQVWALIAPPNLIYVIFVVVGILLESVATARRAIADRVLPSVPTFSYAIAQDFEPDTQIRLLKLGRRIPFFNISAELIAYNMESIPDYHAISYAWTHGPQDDRTIVLNGMSLRVKRNVYDILQRCSSFYETQYIWLDSICIDQSSPSEKTIQVRKMQEIYNRAAHVLVCLGNGSAYLATGLILELKGVRQYFGDAYLTQHVASFLGRQKTDLYLRARVRALHDLLQHPWFRRVWVVQEVVVAKQVTVCYGRHSIPWSTFYESWDLISGPVVSMFALLSSGIDTFSVGLSYLGILSLPFIVAYRVEYKQFGPQRISHLLRVFGAREATVNIDKFFALVGMAKTYSADLKSLVDYENRTKDEILLDLANFLLDNDEAMDVFEFAGIGSHGHNPNLPSWVVDWTKQRSGMPLHTDFAPEAVKYHATRNKFSKMTRGTSRREAVVRGEAVDRIHSIALLQTPSATGQTPQDSTLATLVSYPDIALTHARKHIQDPYQHQRNQPLEEAVWRTLIGDRTHSIRPAPPTYGASLRGQIELMQAMSQIASSYQPTAFLSDAARESLHAQWGVERVLQIQKDNKDFQDIDLLFDDSKGSSPLVFATTEKGYMGMVPRSSRVGDVVCLVFGMHVPCVMRTHEGKWRLVGGAYVHGMMDGEGLDLGMNEKEFTLV